ncbi:hypothetical protein CBS101457_006052 [Exobasidium rhododendri]|nr:hypothetical protein CBS101457_006052 [Exobasidium rhododendri]
MSHTSEIADTMAKMRWRHEKYEAQNVERGEQTQEQEQIALKSGFYKSVVDLSSEEQKLIKLQASKTTRFLLGCDRKTFRPHMFPPTLVTTLSKDGVPLERSSDSIPPISQRSIYSSTRGMGRLTTRTSSTINASSQCSLSESSLFDPRGSQCTTSRSATSPTTSSGHSSFSDDSGGGSPLASRGQEKRSGNLLEPFPPNDIMTHSSSDSEMNIDFIHRRTGDEAHLLEDRALQSLYEDRVCNARLEEMRREERSSTVSADGILDINDADVFAADMLYDLRDIDVPSDALEEIVPLDEASAMPAKKRDNQALHNRREVMPAFWSQGVQSAGLDYDSRDYAESRYESWAAHIQSFGLQGMHDDHRRITTTKQCTTSTENSIKKELSCVNDSDDEKHLKKRRTSSPPAIILRSGSKTRRRSHAPESQLSEKIPGIARDSLPPRSEVSTPEKGSVSSTTSQRKRSGKSGGKGKECVSCEKAEELSGDGERSIEAHVTLKDFQPAEVLDLNDVLCPHPSQSHPFDAIMVDSKGDDNAPIVIDDDDDDDVVYCGIGISQTSRQVSHSCDTFQSKGNNVIDGSDKDDFQLKHSITSTYRLVADPLQQRARSNSAISVSSDASGVPHSRLMDSDDELQDDDEVILVAHNKASKKEILPI